MYIDCMTLFTLTHETKVDIITLEHHFLPKPPGEFFKDLKSAFQKEWRQWQDKPIGEVIGDYELILCEQIKKSNDKDDFIAIPIEKEGKDIGFLHVEGWMYVNRSTPSRLNITSSPPTNPMISHITSSTPTRSNVKSSNITTTEPCSSEKLIAGINA